MVDKTKATRALTVSEIKTLGFFDNKNRWYPKNVRIKPYFTHIRAPSRAYPKSYWAAAGTKKFANWLMGNTPLIAVRFGLIPDKPYWLVRASKVPDTQTYLEAGKTYLCYDLTSDNYCGSIQSGTNIPLIICLQEGCPHLEGGMWEIVNG